MAIRSATEQDCRLIWEWRNEKEARLASFHTEPIPFENHVQWFRKKLNDPRTRILIGIDASGTPVGYVRFDLRDGDAEISVGIDKGHRGKSYGCQMIRKGSKRILSSCEDIARVVAQIKPGNPKSLGAFEKAGFTRQNPSATDGGSVHILTYRDAPSCVIFRTGAEPDIGLGHLRRCLSLAAAFEHMDGSVLFLIDNNPAALQWVQKAGYDCESVPSPWGPEDANHLLSVAKRRRARAVIVDSDRKGLHYLDLIKKGGFLLGSIEDNDAPALPCRMIINGNAHAPQIRYDSSIPDAELLLGTQYTPLPPQYWDAPNRPPAARVPSILISVGGADPFNLTPRLIRTFNEIPGEFFLSVIVGPFFKNKDEVAEASLRSARPCNLLEAPESLYGPILEADLAVSAGGQTLYELACLGRPAVAIKVAENQARQIDRFVDAGVIRYAGDAADENLPSRVKKIVTALLEDEPARRKMIASGHALVDGRGALRVAKKVLALAEPIR